MGYRAQNEGDDWFFPAARDTSTDAAPTVLIVADGAAGSLLSALAGAAGLRVLAVVKPSDAPDRLALTLHLDALLVDLRGAPADDAAGLRMALNGHPQARLLALADLAGLDEALRWLDGHAADWLCEPDRMELAAAVALLAHAARPSLANHNVRERSGEEAAPPLETLSAEVRRLAQVIERLTDTASLETIRRTVSDRRRDYGAPPMDSSFDEGAAPGVRQGVDAPLTPQALHNLLRARRMRDRFFAGSLFADPAWDIMLDLMAARLMGEQVSVSSLCIAAAVPPTTALRWIRQLTERGVLHRVDDPEDGRRVFIALSEEAAEGMSQWWSAIGGNGQEVPAGV